MSYSLSLIIGSHNHIPYGAGDDEFERLYSKRIKPFVVALNNFPKIPAALHYSGVILQWIEQFHSEFFMLIEELVARKQVELLGGGFYEPLLPLLPLTDKIGQIEMFTTYLRKRFGKRPQGCWLPALAWEQNLVGVLNTCGMSYTFLGEGQFAAAGLPSGAPCISEDQGKLITVFPLSTGLYDEIDRDGPLQALERIAGRIPAGGLISLFPGHFVMGDPADSAELRICRFFENLSRAESFVDFTTPSKFYKTRRGHKKGYFPCSVEAGDELPSSSPAFSHPRQFLIGSPEANGIYSKMIFTHALINQLRGDKARKRTAREELWKAQGYNSLCSRGGIRQRAVRGAVYRALLTAEKITRENGRFVPSVMALDFDLDGEEEYLFQQEQINCYIKTRGASVFELDYLPRAWNYLDTLARDGDEAAYRRSAFIDRLVPPELSFHDACTGRFSGSRCCAFERYTLGEMDKAHGIVRFGLSPRQDTPFGDIELEKIYQLKKDVLIVNYKLINRGSERRRFRFIPEIDISLPGEGEAFQRIFVQRQEDKREVLSGEREEPDTAALEIQDIKNEALLGFSADRKFKLWIMPLRTPQPGMGAEQYQSTCFMPVSDVSLESGADWEIKYSLKISANAHLAKK